MTVTIGKSLATDFGGYLNIERFTYEIFDDSTISGIFVSVSVVSDAVSIAFTRGLDGSETSALDALIAAHPTLAAAQTHRVIKLDREIYTFIRERYPVHRQSTLTYLRFKAAEDVLTNRRDYIDGLWTWIDSLLTYFYTKRDEIVAAGTATVADAVTVDFSSYEASDPGVSIETARGIPD